MIGDRLEEEAEKNVAIKVEYSESKDFIKVSGRGELQLGVLIETMRREGFEMTISRPKVLTQLDAQGNILEPVEEVHIDINSEFSGTIIEQLAFRKGLMIDMLPSGPGRQKLIFEIPVRGLVGYNSQFLTSTRGTGIMNRLFKGYEPYKGKITERINGVLISNDKGEATAYSIFNIEDRGKMFIKPGEKVYMGMIIGEHVKDNDLEINIIRAKQLTNIRAAGKDEALRCTPPILFTLEDAISYIQDDELVEVTPENIRLRKKYLDPTSRKRMGANKS
jgi:GTP-binding protein